MKVLKRIFPIFMILAIVLSGCGASASPIDGYDSIPSGADFIIEAGSGSEPFLSPETDSGKKITNTANFYTVFYSTNKVKNNLNSAGLKQYNKAQAFVLESPHWSSIPGQTIAKSEVGIGMTGDLMRSLGLNPGQPTYLPKAQMVDLIKVGVLNLDVCNPTQCNEGNLFYLAIFTHFSGKSVMDLSLIDGSLESQAVLQQTKDLMGKINITTSTDVDARNAFLDNKEGYNAIWAYEPEIANINFTRVSQGLEPIYMVYVDGTIDAAQTLFFSPYFQLTEEDKQDQQKVDSYKAILDDYNKIATAFEKDETIREAIADSGWRPAQYNAEPNTEVLKPEWGFVLNPQTSTGFAPKYETATELNKTFSQVIRDPVINIYIMDLSGSMGDYIPSLNTTGREQLIIASNFIFGPEAETEFLQAIDSDITDVILFDDTCTPLATVNGTETFTLAQQIEYSTKAGNTSMFRCGVDALNKMAEYKTKCETTHECAFVFMTDGADNDCDNYDPCIQSDEFNSARTLLKLDFIPVYGVPLGNANKDKMKEINNIIMCEELLIDCFKQIKGSR